MKDEFRETFEARLTQGAQVFGVGEALCHLPKLSLLARLVLENNKQAGLTRIVQPAEMAAKHFLDSLKLLEYDGWGGAQSAIDVGSGAGFPGLVLAVCRAEVAFTLLEASAKKADFLRMAARDLGVRAEVVHARAEDYAAVGGTGRERFDIGLARAAARLAVSCEYVLPLVRPGGAYLAQVGPYDGAALREIRSTAATGSQRRGTLPWGELGAVLEGLVQYDLPWGYGCRVIACFRKTKETPAKYPRRAGTPARRPLPGFE